MSSLRRENVIGAEIAGALARFWIGGAGPSSSSLSSALALAGYHEEVSGNKHDRVLRAVTRTGDDTAKRVVEELIALLRTSGVFLEASPSEDVVRLRRAFERRGFRLSEEGYVDWTGPSSAETAPFDAGPSSPVLEPASRETVVPTIPLLIDSLRRLPYALRSLASRRRQRPPLSVTDEYDLQDVVEALLRALYSDVRTEERTPSYAGASSEIDFFLKKDAVAVEVKVTRPGRAEKHIKAEILVDINDYQQHPSVSTLIVVVYDLASTFANPDGFTQDLSGVHGRLKVEVVVVGWPLPRG